MTAPAETDRQPVLVCTAWPYSNGSLHVGHLAGAYIPGDVFARYQRLRGRDVLMVSGTDAHGTPITVRADQEGVSPREIVERYHAEFVDNWRQLGISFDLYTSTLTDNHYAVSQDEFLMLKNNGSLFTEKSVGFYDPVARRFLPDTYIEGECPHCHYLSARGNQCENCGRLLEPEELINPRSRLNTEAVLERRETEHFYMNLPAVQERLLEWARPMTHWRPNVYRFTINFLEGGLEPRAITRDLQWGVPVPVQGWDDKRIYVWFEACTGYLSASIEWARNRGTPDAWERWWKDPNCRQYYFIGKDNIPFHTVIWPAILMMRGDTILPYDIPANEYMNFGGQKASKSAGTGTTVPQLLAVYDPDPIRYYLVANSPETADTDFSEDDLIRRNNDELIAAWGNLANRVLTILHRNFDGVVPEHQTDPAVQAAIDEARPKIEDLLESVRLRLALQEVMALARFGNGWINERQPWVQVNTDRAGAAHTLGSLLDLINALKVFTAPFLPFSAERLHTMLGYTGDLTPDYGWRVEPVPAGRKLPAPSPLFKKIDVPKTGSAR